jgi:hypothetical protein
MDDQGRARINYLRNALGDALQVPANEVAEASDAALVAKAAEWFSYAHEVHGKLPGFRDAIVELHEDTLHTLNEVRAEAAALRELGVAPGVAARLETLVDGFPSQIDLAPVETEASHG